MVIIEKLLDAMRQKNSLVCVGLDPDYTKFPRDMLSKWGDDDLVYYFLTEVIQITAPYVCAYKVQKAFFDSLDQGHRILQMVINYLHMNHPEIPVFLDCKIGDIENTMAAYLSNIFGKLEADGVLLNPYMGDDVIVPMARYPDKVGIILVRTSNSGASIVQDYFGLWKHILNMVVGRWNVANNLIPVLASTANINLAEVRAIIPDEMPILYAGFGAQGGDANDLRQLLNSQGIGVFVNSSRGILYPYSVSNQSWRNEIENAVKTMKAQLNEQRG